MAIQAVPYALQNASHSAALFRQSASAPFQTGGILGTGELAVSQQGSPNMSVILGPGRAKVVGNSVSPPAGFTWTTQAMYDVLNDANLTLTVAASNPTNPRIDAVYVQVQDSFYSGATNTAIGGVVTGTPAVSPVAPAVPTNSILIAYIAVAANATTIVNANITYQATTAQLIPSPAVGLVRILPTSAVNGTITALGSVTFSSQTSVSINGCFVGYTHYLIVVDLPTIATAANLLLRLRAAGVDLASSTYVYGGTANNTTATAVGSNGTTTGFYLTRDPVGATNASCRVELWNPNTAAAKRLISSAATGNATYVTGDTVGGGQSSTSVNDGLTLLNDGGFAMTGSISVYGYNIG